jgi:hypothetical protein
VRIIEIETGVENSLWKRLRICRKRNCGMIEWIDGWMDG